MNIQENIELAKYTSFKIGGKAHFFAEVKSKEDLISALEYARQNSLPFFILGGGTNMLVRDQGFVGLVIRNQIKNIEMQEGLIVSGTALTLPEIYNFAFKNSLVGFEKLATVPGTLGGAVYNNAHYLDSLLADFVEWVEVINPQTLELQKISKTEMQFEYDSSKVKKENLPAVAVALRLPKGDAAESRKQFLELLKKRSDSQPYGTMNSGCMFQNVKAQLGPGHNGTSVGWLVEQCGLKGAKIGDAAISEKHGNFFINQGHASSEDILKLAEMCQNKVREKFGVDLEFEIKII